LGGAAACHPRSDATRTSQRLVKKGEIMSQKNVARLAWTLCGLVVMAALITAMIDLRSRPADDNMLNLILSLTYSITLPAFAVIGALIISRQPRNWVGWLLMIEAALVFIFPLDTYFSGMLEAPAHPSLWTLVGLWFYSWAWLWFIFPLLFIPLFFPTGKLLSPRWRWLVGLGIGLCLFFIFMRTFMNVLMNDAQEWTVPNPIGFLPIDAFPAGLWFALLPFFAVMCVVSLIVRYRRTQQVERDQIKWLLYAAALFMTFYVIMLFTKGIGGTVDALMRTLRDLAIFLLPLSIGVAILRHGLYDINLIIRKTVQYGAVTAVLALVYFGTVILLQTLLGRATGEQSPLIIVLSTLLVAGLFNPLRQRVQKFVDRRFYRQKYDAQQVLAQFAQTARDEVDMERLQAELLRVVQETMQPETITVWLKGTRK
jgi:hypothetical protein